MVLPTTGEDPEDGTDRHDGTGEHEGGSKAHRLGDRPTENRPDDERESVRTPHARVDASPESDRDTAGDEELARLTHRPESGTGDEPCEDQQHGELGQSEHDHTRGRGSDGDEEQVIVRAPLCERTGRNPDERSTDAKGAHHHADCRQTDAGVLEVERDDRQDDADAERHHGDGHVERRDQPPQLGPHGSIRIELPGHVSRRGQEPTTIR